MSSNLIIKTKLKARVIGFKSVDNFYIQNHVLTREQKRLLNETSSLKYHSGALIYQARPYTTDIGQIKMYQDHYKTLHRCKILDLTTHFRNSRLIVLAIIKLIDNGRQIRADLQELFDFPQSLDDVKELEPEAKQARLYFGETVPSDFKNIEVDKYFIKQVNTQKDYTIEIIDFKNDTYYVDLLNHKNCSLVEHLKSKFVNIFSEFDGWHKPIKKEANSDSVLYQPVLNFGFQRQNNLAQIERKPRTKRLLNSARTLGRPAGYYYDVIDFFQKKLRHTAQDDSPHLKSRFFKVKVLSWSNPDSFFIIPEDHDYSASYAAFMKDLHEYSDRIDMEQKGDFYTQKFYKVGEKCMFRNDCDTSLGKWLRGIVTGSPCLYKGQHLIRSNLSRSYQQSRCNSHDDLRSEDEDDNEDEDGNEDNDGNEKEDRDEYQLDLTNIGHLVFRVQSIDFGFQCFRSVINLRPVTGRDEQFFDSKGPWALRCRLFGVEPLDQLNKSGSLRAMNYTSTCQYPAICRRMIDNWIREKILDSNNDTKFQILFRSSIMSIPKSWRVNMDEDKVVSISLFHRFEPPYTVEDCIGPRKRKTRYECLNSYLVDRGYATDYNFKTNISSCIDLDEFIVNLLVSHDMI